MSQDLTDYKSILVQVMTWCRQATSHYLVQYMDCLELSVFCCTNYLVSSSGRNELPKAMKFSQNGNKIVGNVWTENWITIGFVVSTYHTFSWCGFRANLFILWLYLILLFCRLVLYHVLMGEFIVPDIRSAIRGTVFSSVHFIHYSDKYDTYHNIQYTSYHKHHTQPGWAYLSLLIHDIHIVGFHRHENTFTNHVHVIKYSGVTLNISTCFKVRY